MLVIPAATASAGEQPPGCSIQGIVLEQFSLPSGRNYARLIGLGNCGRGYEPNYGWEHLTVRENGRLRRLRLSDAYEVQFRLRVPNARISGTLQLAYGSAVASCSFTLSRSNYERICS
jgi:hypothetical protein